MSAPEPHLRLAEPPDDPFLDALYATTRERDLGAMPLPAEVKQELLSMQSRSQRTDYRRRFPRAEALIIELDGRAAGRFYIDKSGAEFRVIDLSLLPEHRGRGIGGRLLAALLAEASRLGRSVRLRVDHSNPARRLYERLGFQPEEDAGIHCSMVWTAPMTAGWNATERPQGIS
jgi:ribosomal protein S18 acetylase RimI-like enzyme